MKVGIDLVDLHKIDINNNNFIKHILSLEEYACFMKCSTNKRKLEYLGGRFAVKEAYLKACGKGIGGINFHDIICLNHEDGSPYLNDENTSVSLSHENHYVIAIVVKFDI